ncbi:response regulator [Paludibacterium purpuratum]|uniref:Putative two-component system response regulator n=1 Tax=Paludibacterium purpuratum TaxID=1144873 RepID=A0A4R7AZ04_9NEIS|nr:two-component system response regulator [Paludibacterium purpuratum]TDR72036.1 putative two-component system response regulator [Paludibacterium purpuratum]
MTQMPGTPKNQTILIVDDTSINLTLMNELLKGQYRTLTANSGEQALQIMQNDTPDLILLDVMMPGIGGLEACRQIKNNPKTAGIPVIFLTAKSDIEDEQIGFITGAVDYITKPISPAIVLARIKTHLKLKAMNDFLSDANAFLTSEVERRTHEVQVIQDVTIMAMATLAETRDSDTGQHLRRTQNYVRRLAQALQSHPQFCDALTDENIELIYKSAPLHDIGKVGIPDRILLKPGKLTPEEFEIMKSHTVMGRDAIAAAEKLLDTPSSFLRFAREIAHRHQEKWDGSGYPDGLSGNDIPVAARLMAVADVYDALISRRVYKPAFPHADAVTMIQAQSGKHFDPAMVDAFVRIADDFQEIAQRFSDPETSDREHE